MKSKFLKVIIIGSTVLAIVGISLFQGKATSANKKTFPTDGKVTEYLNQMPECINAMDTSVQMSSNPYDYIKNNECYDKILELGISALPELEDYLDNSKQSGLVEYIVAIAIGEITGTNVNAIEENPSYCGWATAYEFRDNWNDIKAHLSEDLENIINSESLSEEEKLDKINDYGKIAIPEIESYLGEIEKSSSSEKNMKSFELDQDVNNCSNLNDKLKEFVDSQNLTQEENEILNQFVKE